MYWKRECIRVAGWHLHVTQAVIIWECCSSVITYLPSTPTYSCFQYIVLFGKCQVVNMEVWCTFNFTNKATTEVVLLDLVTIMLHWFSIYSQQGAHQACHVLQTRASASVLVSKYPHIHPLFKWKKGSQVRRVSQQNRFNFIVHFGRSAYTERLLLMLSNNVEVRLLGDLPNV